MTKAVVLIPTHNHPLMLPFAIRSVQDQTVGDIRIAVIGDGVGDDTRDVLATIMADDDRVSFHDYPKAGRTGEPHRHTYLTTEADSATEMVTYLSDDDLYLPDHVATMAELLAGNDAAHALPGHIDEHGVLHCEAADLGDAAWAKLEFTLSFVSLTGFAHRMDAYHRLPYGWRSTPTGRYTDQYMMQQFLAQPWCRMGAAQRPTAVRFPDSLRKAMSPQQRADEVASWVTRLETAEGRSDYIEASEDAFRRAASAARRTTFEQGLHIEHLNAEFQRERETRTVLAATMDAERAARDLGREGIAAELASAQSHAATLQSALHETEVRLVQAEGEVRSLRGAIITAEERVNVVQRAHDELLATRVVRLRDQLVRIGVLRKLLARRS